MHKTLFFCILPKKSINGANVSKEAFGVAPPAIKLCLWKRIVANLDLWIVDHGFLRAIYSNKFTLPGPMYRANQPSTRQLRRYFKTLGLKSVINLRGFNPNEGRYQLEAETCERFGVKLINVRVNSRALPSANQIKWLKKVIEVMPLPALAHCKSGADRAGLFSTLYCHFRLGQPIAEARKQLGWKYGHFRGAKTGVLDQLFESYLNDTNKLKEGPQLQESSDFLYWVNNYYNPEEIEKKFKPKGIAKLWIDDIVHRE